MLNFVMAVLLLHWPMALVMAISGLLPVILILSHCTNLTSELGSLGTLQFRISYVLLLCSSFLLALFKHKKVYRELEMCNMLLKDTQKENQSCPSTSIATPRTIGKRNASRKYPALP